MIHIFTLPQLQSFFFFFFGIYLFLWFCPFLQWIYSFCASFLFKWPLLLLFFSSAWFSFRVFFSFSDSLELHALSCFWQLFLQLSGNSPCNLIRSSFSRMRTIILKVHLGSRVVSFPCSSGQIILIPPWVAGWWSSYVQGWKISSWMPPWVAGWWSSHVQGWKLSSWIFALSSRLLQRYKATCPKLRRWKEMPTWLWRWEMTWWRI